MPKEDRSDWVAVEPEYQSTATSEIRKATSAYQYFQKEVSSIVKHEVVQLYGTFDIAKHGGMIRDKWSNLSDDEKEKYYILQRNDQARFAQESHLADIAAIERKEKLRQERDAFIFDDDLDGNTKRTTRHKWDKKQRKKMKQQIQAKVKKADGIEFNDDDDEDDDDGQAGSWDDSDDSSAEKRKKAAKATQPKRELTQKQIEHREKTRQDKVEKEAYIAERQYDLRVDRADQAKKRLDFLLKQSNIFSHFGGVKEDTARYGSTRTTTSTATTSVPTTNVNSSNDDHDKDNNHTNDAGLDKSATSRRGRQSMNVDDDDDDEARALAEADEHEATFLTQQPTTLGFGKMRDYQLEGLNWMIRLQENGVNGILADEMGLGKTLQSISILVYMLEYKHVTGPHLIVVPKSTLSNWMNEIARWAPTLSAVKFHGDRETREDIISTILEPGQRDEERDWHVVVTTYEICNLEKNTLNKFAWSYLIIDEAHRLKNEDSAFSKTVRQFETRYRILLTGTPLQNSLHELWALLNFLVPDVFASSEQFDEWFNLDIEDADEKNKLISQLHKILRPFMLRRLKADVEKSLPPKHETILYTGMSVMQKKLYRDILIRDIEAIQGTSGSRTAILNIVMQLRKCAGHPYLFPGVEDRTLPPLGEHLVENCGKMVVLDKLLMRLHEKGLRVLLFTQMTRILDLMEDYLVMRRFNYCRIDGKTSYEDREAYIEAYNKPDSEKFLFLLSTRAGGLGINLQTASVVILYDSDWNPQADLQAQDRAHRIGQKLPVQVFRLVTEHTIEEKIVERAQQKLKLDAMVVQSGRLKDRDNKLSRDELLSAVRFGADKIFKSKDSSITDDDIDLILDAGKKKTQELNDKLKTADKGDMLDFKLDGSSVQTFDGIDYSKSALNKAKADAEILGLFDIGKRERKEANYNEKSIYKQQMTSLQTKATTKKKAFKLPKELRLPRMEEWQMFDREALIKIQDEEETAFKHLPEDIQKRAVANMKGNEMSSEGEGTAEGFESDLNEPFELPPLLNEERQAEKDKLLKEGFSQWKRQDYNMFVKGSATYGRDAFDKIALEVGQPESAVYDFATAFWGELGKSRIAEHEYDRVSKMVERGEKKIEEIKNLERATSILVFHFDNPWEDLEFTHVNCKDKFFTAEEDRHLLCWSHKYGYGQWVAVKYAIRRNPKFNYNYLLRSLPIDQLGKRCEQLMKAAEKEVEQLEKFAREAVGIICEPDQDQKTLPPIDIPPFRILQKQRHEAQRSKADRERRELENKVAEVDAQINDAQERLKALNNYKNVYHHRAPPNAKHSSYSKSEPSASKTPTKDLHRRDDSTSAEGAIGPRGEFVIFPLYDGIAPPLEWKKPFTQYCNHTKKELKDSLPSDQRKNKHKVQELLKEGWLKLPDDKKDVFREWTEWDKKRYSRDLKIYDKSRSDEHDEDVDNDIDNNDDKMKSVHVPKKRKQPSGEENSNIPRKRK